MVPSAASAEPEALPVLQYREGERPHWIGPESPADATAVKAHRAGATLILASSSRYEGKRLGNSASRAASASIAALA